ncbi:MAG: isochorismatase family protein [Armatimonadetes bacterium]|nr:isochorismatase family protein [Armatimonadota bacterium]
MLYRNELRKLDNPPPLLADYPGFVEPMPCDDRYLAPPVVDEPDADLLVRAWRFWYNARGIVEMENRLQGKATAIVMVHPWGIDDGWGMETPEPAGLAFFCVRYKNEFCGAHIRTVVNPFVRRLRPHVALVGCSMPLVEDPIRKLMYASINTPPEALNRAEGERQMQALLRSHDFTGKPLVSEFELDPDLPPARAYMLQTPSTDAYHGYNGEGYWELPMPVHRDLDWAPTDRVFYDGEGYPKVRDYLKRLGIRHVLLTGYATDMCLKSTTCGYENMCQDFNVFIVGDATMATYPGVTTPRFATQVALHNAALWQLVTQVNWVRLA